MKRAVSAASPAASNKQSTKVGSYFRAVPTAVLFLFLLHALMCQMQRSRAEEEGKWDAVSKAIQKVQLGIHNRFFIVLLMLAP
jgi:hypothetical protein